MSLFHVYAEAQIIGSTTLEFGDPPMGVAFGTFKPNDNYASLRKRDGTIKVSLQAQDGSIVPCQGAFVRDMSEEFGPEAVEVEAVGMPHPIYQRLFPEHVQAYDAKFR